MEVGEGVTIESSEYKKKNDGGITYRVALLPNINIKASRNIYVRYTIFNKINLFFLMKCTN